LLHTSDLNKVGPKSGKGRGHTQLPEGGGNSGASLKAFRRASIANKRGRKGQAEKGERERGGEMKEGYLQA